MKILVAEDDVVTRKMLVVTLERLGWEVIQAEDGNAAWQLFETLKGKDAPELAVLDWMMPGVEGIEICRRLRTTPGFELVYVILVTSRGGKEDLSYGLAAGANDYITKPFDPVELQARVRVGERMVRLQRSLAARVTEVEAALAHVQLLQENSKRGKLLGAGRVLPGGAFGSRLHPQHLPPVHGEDDEGD